MLDLANHIVGQKSTAFDPEKFEDHYEDARTKFINLKCSAKAIGANLALEVRTSSI